MPLPVIRISRRGADRLRAGHVWVYRSELRSGEEAPPGALVDVADERGRTLASALYSSTSEIALRILVAHTRHSPNLRSDEELLELLRARVRTAIVYRARTVCNTDAYRVLFSEADGTPGFVADRYNTVLCFQALTQAMDRPELKQAMTEELMRHLAPLGVTSLVERTDPHIRQLEQLPPSAGGILQGQESESIFSMNGLRFHFSAGSGQKTGAFLDQRENYAAAALYARGQALDVFCYQGGFALHLAKVCQSVAALDSSRPALEVAEKNERLNPGAAEVEWIEGNAFDFLKERSALGEQYDTIVLDPPAFAKGKRNVETALRGYKELNLRALKMLRPGGTLVSCSCSYHVSETDFLQILVSAAADTRKTLRLIEQRTQSLDHPILLAVPETKYLKCVICSLS